MACKSGFCLCNSYAPDGNYYYFTKCGPRVSHPLPITCVGTFSAEIRDSNIISHIRLSSRIVLKVTEYIIDRWIQNNIIDVIIYYCCTRIIINKPVIKYFIICSTLITVSPRYKVLSRNVSDVYFIDDFILYLIRGKHPQTFIRLRPLMYIFF